MVNSTKPAGTMVVGATSRELRTSITETVQHVIAVPSPQANPVTENRAARSTVVLSRAPTGTAPTRSKMAQAISTPSTGGAKSN